MCGKFRGFLALGQSCKKKSFGCRICNRSQ